MAGKETIGIEALLHRAYGQYRVDRVTPAAILGLKRSAPSSSLAGAMSALQLGTIVDNSGIAARMLGAQSMAIATPDDMLVVHDHVLALADWLIESAETDAPLVWRRQEIAAHGWRIEDAATGLWLVRPGDERETAGDMWARLHNPYLMALVIEHARAGSVPDHGGPLPAGRGRPDAVALAERADVLLARAVYATWHAALTLIAAELDAALDRHHVLAPVSPAAPWDTGRAGAVLASQAGTALAEGNSVGHKPLRKRANC